MSDECIGLILFVAIAVLLGLMDYRPTKKEKAMSNSEKGNIGIRELVRLATGHATGILESTDDVAFWGEEFYDKYGYNDENMRAMVKARKIVMNKIEAKK